MVEHLVLNEIKQDDEGCRVYLGFCLAKSLNVVRLGKHVDVGDDGAVRVFDSCAIDEYFIDNLDEPSPPVYKFYGCDVHAGHSFGPEKFELHFSGNSKEFTATEKAKEPTPGEMKDLLIQSLQAELNRLRALPFRRDRDMGPLPTSVGQPSRAAETHPIVGQWSATPTVKPNEQYLVVIRCAMDDVPFRLTDNELIARGAVPEDGVIPEEIVRALKLKNLTDPCNVSIIKFIDGVPAGCELIRRLD